MNKKIIWKTQPTRLNPRNETEYLNIPLSVKDSKSIIYMLQQSKLQAKIFICEFFQTL